MNIYKKAYPDKLRLLSLATSVSEYDLESPTAFPFFLAVEDIEFALLGSSVLLSLSILDAATPTVLAGISGNKGWHW